MVMVGSRTGGSRFTKVTDNLLLTLAAKGPLA